MAIKKPNYWWIVFIACCSPLKAFQQEILDSIPIQELQSITVSATRLEKVLL